MKFRTGIIVGAAAGYYLGAKAGRKRFLQINRAFRQIRGNEQVEDAAGKVRAVIDLTKERAREIYEQRAGTSDLYIDDVTQSLN